MEMKQLHIAVALDFYLEGIPFALLDIQRAPALEQSAIESWSTLVLPSIESRDE